MAYADKGAGSNKLVSVLLVVLLHIALGFGLIMGLGYEAVKKAVVDTVAINVEEEVPEEEPPPPPEIEPMETPPPPITAPPTPFTPPSTNTARPQPPQPDVPFTPKADPVPQPTARQCNGRTVMLLEGQPCPDPDMKTCWNGQRIPENQACPPETKKCPGGQTIPVADTCPAVGKSQPLKPKGNPGSWVPQSAYPRGPLRDGVEGTVGFTLSVGPDGRPTNCSVTSSSGNGELDAAACSNLMKRAKFDPKMENGQAVASSYSNRVRWVIPK